MITLVLLPGLDGTGDLFGPFVAAIGTGYRTQVVQYPADVVLGYGELERLVRAALPASDRFVVLAEASIVSVSGPHLLLQTRPAQSAAEVGAFIRALQNETQQLAET